MPVKQDARIMAIATPLGADKLVLRRLSGREELGRMFEFKLDLISEDPAIPFDDIVGQNVTISLSLADSKRRYFNGFVSEFVQTTAQGGFPEYRAVVVPHLWLMTRTSDCRIFQNKKVPDILKEMFQKHGFSDIEDTLDVSNYRTWENCVQYRETDFNFISRLMEQEGIYYYFKYENGKHTLVLADSLSKHNPYEGYETIDFRRPGEQNILKEEIVDWTIRSVIQPGKFAHTDYNFKTPRTQLLNPASVEQAHARADYEIFDYPGAFVEGGEGEQYARIRIEELQAQHEVLTGQTNARGICPGFKFTLKDHPREDQNREYLITSAEYLVNADGFETGKDQPDTKAFTCTFTAIDATVQFRPARRTPKPSIRGTQTAVVVGPSGEEIYPDEFGRVKVQFPWDRYGEMNENSSCWIRVSQVHAGKTFGGIDLPRIGEEVVVGYLEGDPDQPLIIGRVYNAEQKVPFSLPGQMVVSGMKSNSTKGGGGYNEMSMNDTKGKEKITVHGQYDMGTTVEHDQTLTVHNDRTQTVDNNDSLTVTKGNRTVTVQSGTNAETIKGNSTHTVEAGNRAVSVSGGDYSATASAAVFLHGKGAGVGITGDAKGVTVSGSGQGVGIKGAGGPGVGIHGDPNVEINGASKVSIVSPLVLIGDATIKIGGSSIELSAGGCSITLAMGLVSIGGPAIKVAADGMCDITGAMVKLNP